MTDSFQFLKYENDKLVFDRDIWDTEMGHIDQDMHFATIGISGPLRSGKSLLLNLLSQTLKGNDNDNNKVPHHFNWKPGTEAGTYGMWINKTPINLKNINGDIIPTFCIDTQGIFDGYSDSKTDVILFSLTSLLSSYQIYNVEKRIQEDMLQHLELFSEYAKVVSGTGHHPLQTLMILIRDWQHGDINDDYIEYQRHIDEYFHKIMNGNYNEKAIQTRNNIKNCYSDITCTALPYPGNTVSECAESLVSMDQVREDFLNRLQGVSFMISQSLEKKKVLSQPIRLRDLADYIDNFLALLQENDKLPEPSTIFEITVSAFYNSLLKDSEKMYREWMQKKIADCDEFIFPPVYKRLAHDTYNQTLDHIKPKLGLGSDERKQAFRTLLRDKTEEIDRELKREVEEDLRWLNYIWIFLTAMAMLFVSSSVNYVCSWDICIKISKTMYILFFILIGYLLYSLMRVSKRVLSLVKWYYGKIA